MNINQSSDWSEFAKDAARTLRQLSEDKLSSEEASWFFKRYQGAVSDEVRSFLVSTIWERFSGTDDIPQLIILFEAGKSEADVIDFMNKPAKTDDHTSGALTCYTKVIGD